MPCSFQRIMDRIFNKQISAGDVECYLDDLLAYAKDENDMFCIPTGAFQNLRESGMFVNLSKCKFHEGYSACPEKVKAITNVTIPSTLRSVRSYIGMLQFYRDSIEKFSLLIRPLTRLMSKTAGWLGEICSCPCLACRNKYYQLA